MTKAMNFLSNRMQMRSPMTPPTTPKMMRVTVLSTSSTAWPEQGEEGVGEGSGSHLEPGILAARRLQPSDPGSAALPRPCSRK